MNDNQLILQGVPLDYVYCLSTECPAASGCLHRLAVDALSADAVAVKAYAPQHIRPAAGEECPQYKPVKTVRYARGYMRSLRTLRTDRMGYAIDELAANATSKRMYYCERRGDVLLSPERQADIAAILQSYGADTPIEFDRYEEGVAW